MNRNFLPATMLAAMILFAFPSVSAKTDWEIYKLSSSDQEFKILYNTGNVNMSRIMAEPESFSLIVYLTDMKENAELDITIPRELVAGIPLSDNLFLILDGKEIESFEETASSQCFRTLSIHLPSEHLGEESVLEIIGSTPSMMPTIEKIPLIHLTTEWNEQSKEVFVSGCTSLALNDEKVVVEILDQNGATYKTLSVMPDESGSFLTTLPLSNEQLADGTYTVSAEYDDQRTGNVFVVPEFPLITMIILGLSTSFLLVLKRIGFSKI